MYGKESSSSEDVEWTHTEDLNLHFDSELKKTNKQQQQNQQKTNKQTTTTKKTIRCATSKKQVG